MERYAYKDCERFDAIRATSFHAHQLLNVQWLGPGKLAYKYCDGKHIHFRGYLPFYERPPRIFADLLMCVCGFWKLTVTNMEDDELRHYVAILQKFDISSDDAPLDCIKRELSHNWRLAKHISAQLAEDLVCSIFQEHLDWEVHYLTDSVFTPDKGIDFVLVNIKGTAMYWHSRLPIEVAGN